MSSSSNFIQGQSRRSFTGNENEGGLSYGYTLAFTRPWINLYPDTSGNYPNNPNYAGNPLFVRDKARNDDDNNRLIQSLKLTTKIIDGEKDRLRMIWSGGLTLAMKLMFMYQKFIKPKMVVIMDLLIGKNNFKNYNLRLRSLEQGCT